MKLFFILLSSFAILTACKKEGCTDNLAENFDKEAEKENNTCTYEGTLTFWINANSSIDFNNNMIDELFVYVDGTKIGQMTSTSNQLTTPDCGSIGLTYYENFGLEESKLISYKITYEQYVGPGPKEEFTYTEGTLKIEGGQCTTFQIQ
jgi:hypothetical protein